MSRCRALLTSAAAVAILAACGSSGSGLPSDVQDCSNSIYDKIELAHPGSTIYFGEATRKPSDDLCYGLSPAKQTAAWRDAIKQVGVKDPNALSIYVPYPN